jgi:hypothetical protein
MLNLTFFSNTVSWDGIDQYHALPILDQFDNALAGKTEIRGALIVSKKMKSALRLLVTLSDHRGSFQVNYRIKSLKDKVDLGNGFVFPMEHVDVDVSAADTNLGLRQDSSYSFSLNNIMVESGTYITNLLDFIISSEFIATQDTNIFDDLLDKDVLNYPPCAGDPHYCPVFLVSKLDVGNYIKDL